MNEKDIMEGYLKVGCMLGYFIEKKGRYYLAKHIGNSIKSLLSEEDISKLKKKNVKKNIIALFSNPHSEKGEIEIDVTFWNSVVAKKKGNNAFARIVREIITKGDKQFRENEENYNPVLFILAVFFFIRENLIEEVFIEKGNKWQISN